MAGKAQRVLGVLIGCSMIATACGSEDPPTSEAAAPEQVESSVAQAVEAADDSIPEEVPTTTTSTAPTTTTSEAPSPATTVPEDELSDAERTYPRLPVSDDPCANEPVAGDVTYSIVVDGKERPVLVSWDEAAIEAENPFLQIRLHGAGQSVELERPRADLFRDSVPQIVVVPSPGDAGANFWSETPEFNITFVETLWDQLRKSVCFDQSRVRMIGTGQGAFVTAETICKTDIPLQLVSMSLGLISLESCDPSRKVPIISYNVFEFNAALGAHWDGSWTPPGEHETESTGGIGPVPDDLDEWADVYGCAGERVEETLSDPNDAFERDTIVLSYPDCEAPLFAYGIENGEQSPFELTALTQTFGHSFEQFPAVFGQ